MKAVLMLALVAVAVAQWGGHRPNFDHGDPLHHLIHQEVGQILTDDPNLSADSCQTKCDALFDLNAGHDEEITDRLCREECEHQLRQNAN